MCRSTWPCPSPGRRRDLRPSERRVACLALRAAARLRHQPGWTCWSFAPFWSPGLASRAHSTPTSCASDFPILQERVHGKRLIWLDNAATTQKPQPVIDRLAYYYEHENSNVHRAAHTLAARSTDAYEDARKKVARFINAADSGEIVWVRGTTEAINLVANAWGRKNVGAGDEILITWLEHHANIVPWQMLCNATGATLKVAPVDDSGQIILSEYHRLVTRKTRLVAFTHVSNALGTVTPAHEMVEIAHRAGARVLIDGAQSVPHLKVDVQELDCDFFVFSGHKLFAPTGIGVLYGKADVLADMPPWQGGGNMIADVTHERTLFQPPPFRFEAGTGSIADAVALGTAIEYVESLGLDAIAAHEHELLEYGTKELRRVPGLHLIGTATNKAAIWSFVLDGHHTEDVAAALDAAGIAVRAGHHCAQPTLRRFGVEATVRPSVALYNTHEDLDALVDALFRLQSGAIEPPPRGGRYYVDSADPGRRRLSPRPLPLLNLPRNRQPRSCASRGRAQLGVPGCACPASSRLPSAFRP